MRKMAILLVAILLTAPLAFADVLLEEGFEGGAIPAGWTVIDEDPDGNEWFAYNNASMAYTGDYAAAVACYSSDDAANDWLITPQLFLRDDDWMAFWARSWYGTEDFEVRLSTTGTAPEDFTVTLATETVGSTYVRYEYDLSAFDGQDCYLGIVWYYTDYAFLVDDVMVGSSNPVGNEDASWSEIKALYR